MKPVAFDYCRPENAAEAVALLAELRENASVLAGGMSLGPMLNLRLVRPRAVIDITRVAELGEIAARPDRLVTGATLRQADAFASAAVGRAVPLLHLALPWVGHFQTRNRGTLGGSIAHADPAAEIPLCLVTLDGTVVLRSRRRERRVAARDFFLGTLSTAREPDELITALEWPIAPTGAGHGFEEIAQRHGDFAIAAAACQLRIDGAGRIAALRLGLGGVEDRPIAIDAASLIGQAADAGAGDGLATIVERAVSPIEDHVAEPEYRRHLAGVLTRRVFAQAADDARRRRQ